MLTSNTCIQRHQHHQHPSKQKRCRDETKSVGCVVPFVWSFLNFVQGAKGRLLCWPLDEGLSEVAALLLMIEIGITNVSCVWFFDSNTRPTRVLVRTTVAAVKAVQSFVYLLFKGRHKVCNGELRRGRPIFGTLTKDGARGNRWN